MANTFELISSVTVGAGGAASIDFTSIPSTYTDLCVKVSARTTSGSSAWAGLYLTFNGSGTSYAARYLQGNGSAASSITGGSTVIEAALAASSVATANTFGNSEFYIPNYAGSANKSLSADSVQETNAAAALIELVAGTWSNSAAITNISLVPQSSWSFAQYSTAYLYGVKNA